ncbi:hypothetical protein GGI12_003102 [Dipsacomyces acuminosporus]|nr:hypothetical protein GGI12_003102 [Dipsacomyces acuminosporus]
MLLTELAAEDGRLQVKRGAKDASTAALQKLPATVRDVWDMIMTAFGGYAGNVDSEVLVPTVLLCLKLRDAKTARDIVEAWLATLSDETMYLLQESGNADNTNGSSKSILGTRPGVVSHQQHKTMVQASYLRVCELYALHILPQLNDFTSAYEFLNMCTAVSATTRDGFVKRLDSLRSPAPVKKRAKNRSKKQSAKPKATAAPKAASGSSEQASGSTAAMVPAEAKQAVSAAYVASNPNANANANANADRDGDEASAKSTALPSLASVYAKSKHSTSNGNSSSGTGSSGRSRTRPGVKTRALVRKPKSTISIVWQVVRRLMSRWGFTLFTLAIVAAVLRMLTQRFRLPPLFNAITRKLWNTIKMGTQVTYI